MLKSALSGASLTAILLSFSLPALAQDEMEEIITTGTPLFQTLEILLSVSRFSQAKS